MTERETILQKIRKLRALAEDESLGEAEATTYLAKMGELMRKHTVQEHELGAPAELDRVGMNFNNKYFDAWRLGLITECSTDCGTYVIMYRKARPEPYFRIYGRPENVEACWEMYKFIEQQIVTISREMYSQTKLSRQAQKGLAIGVCERLGVIRDEYKLESGGGTELIVLETEQDFAKAAMTGELGEPRQSKRRAIQMTDAVAQGYRQADRVKLNREVTSD